MQPADDSTIPPATARAIAARHGLRADTLRLLRVGASVTVYLLGEGHVLRMLRRVADDPVAARTEVVAVRVAREAGVHAPQLVAFDDTRELLPMPYAVYERVEGEALESLGLLGRPPGAEPQVWRALGRDLALIHTRVSPDGPAGQLAALSVDPDPRPWLEEIAANAHLSPAEARWLLGWLDRLEPIARLLFSPQFCHGDVNASNVMARWQAAGALEYAALLDWDAAGWCDPAWDFSGVPPWAALLMLAGHREVAPLVQDETAEVRILWSHLQLALFSLHRKRGHRPAWRTAWDVRRLLAGTRFFVEATYLRELGPSAP